MNNISNKSCGVIVCCALTRAAVSGPQTNEKRTDYTGGFTMNDHSKTLAKMKKAGKLVRLAQRKNGPKSYKRGQGALLRILLENDGATQRELVSAMGMNRGALKDIVRKAERNGFVTIETTGKKTYSVKLTEEGKKLAEKHEAAQDKTAKSILTALSAEEIAQLDAISEKLIVACKEAGVNGKGKGHKVRRKRKCVRH